jgi:hypothetical protein
MNACRPVEAMCYRQDDRLKKKGMNPVHLIFNNLIVVVLVITWPFALSAQVRQVRGHPLEGSGQVGAGIPLVLNFVLFNSLSHDSKPTRITASEFSLVAASTPLPESHQSPIRIKAWRRGLSGPWPLGGPRKPLVPRRVQTRGSQIQWLPDGSNLLRAHA